jgi:hypothetical protein
MRIPGSILKTTAPGDDHGAGSTSFPKRISEMEKPTNFFDTDYAAKMNTYLAQQQAAHDNREAHDAFVLASRNWVAANTLNREKGLPITISPVPPTQTVVDDDGTVRHVPFGDLSRPTLPAVAVTPSAQPVPQAVNVPLDRTDIMMGMLRQIYDELTGLSVKLGA